ncbi:hypothetical protein [Agromyces archimandritae]|uniref:Lipoprotein n=1 Tax=Agromyces archimandritae TaxID=2781962 RepID=A0A975IPZ3_9MICO|nr:hypothetical protein [Agromyces archimandritae]QTX05809.1 hypothetical protein G127AT_06295 [Agromyces archimandritae]
MPLTTKTALVLVAASLLTLTSCSSAADTAGGSAQGSVAAEQQEPLDLSGQWTQMNSESADSYQAAIIDGDTITVNWVNEADSSAALYWAGSYAAPGEAADTYSWTSEGDTEQMSSALLASGDDTKEFAYADGVLSYELTAMGVTMTVEMSQD